MPSLCDGNPGIGVDAKVEFANSEQSWTERVHLVNTAVAAFKTLGIAVTNNKTWISHPESGFIIQPQLVSLEPLDDGGVRTVTTVQVNHPSLAPDGVFEYQHAWGESMAESIAQGLEMWMKTDFETLLEAQRPKPKNCMMMKMDFPAQDSQPARARSAIFGPIAHFVENPRPAPEQYSADEHPFCPCCLLTRSIEAFKHLFESDGFFGVRLFASRDEEGSSMADCRINGLDYEPGAEALRKYVDSWEPAGVEFRKQYVVISNAR